MRCVYVFGLVVCLHGVAACGGDDSGSESGGETDSASGTESNGSASGSADGDDDGGTDGGDGSASGTSASEGTGSDGGDTGGTGEPDDSLSWSPVGPDGWTVYEPHADTVMIYVSSSEGDDANDGLSEQDPVQTIARALEIAKMRSQDATMPRPDWVLFRAGDTWRENFQFRADTVRGGLSIEYPFILGAYGDGDRPRFIWAEGGPPWSYGWWGGNFPTGDEAPAYWSIMGLEFYTSTKDPDSADFEDGRIYDGSNPPSVMFQQEGHHILFEDCLFQYTTLVAQNGWPHHIAIRRSLFLDNYGYHDHTDTDSVYHHAQGLYMNEVDEILIEENVFDHNGWLDENTYPTTGPTIYNHNIYLNSDTTNVIGHKNITARGSADGFKTRGGGNLINNLGIANGIGLSINERGYDGVDQTARYNVITESLNLPLHGPVDSSGHAERDWGIHFGDPITEAVLDVAGNIVAHSPGGRRPVASGCEAIPACAAEHIVYAWGDDPDTPGSYPEPERNLETYMTMLGQTPTMEAFIEEARKQSRSNWRPEYTAAAFNDYMREGFGVTKE